MFGRLIATGSKKDEKYENERNEEKRRNTRKLPALAFQSSINRVVICLIFSLLKTKAIYAWIYWYINIL